MCASLASTIEYLIKSLIIYDKHEIIDQVAVPFDLGSVVSGVKKGTRAATAGVVVSLKDEQRQGGIYNVIAAL